MNPPAPPGNRRLPWRYALKVLARSRSFGFMIDAARQTPTPSLGRLRWSGREIFYRPGTSDPFVIYQVLLKAGAKAEYYVPPALAPEVIVDIGSNIGASILYFHALFPRARIFGFEPHPGSFAILRQNVAALPGVTVLNYGLGEADDKITAPDSSNFSCFSTQASSWHEGTPAPTTACEIRAAGKAFAELGITKIDLLKIDCEGSEVEIVEATPEPLLRSCGWIVGEIHDASGFQILARLAPHFELDLKKRMFSSSFRFHACNQTLAPALRGTFERRTLQL